MATSELLQLLDGEERRLLQMADDSCLAWKRALEDAVKRLHRKIWEAKIEGQGVESHQLDDLPNPKQPVEPLEVPILTPSAGTSPQVISPLSSGVNSDTSSDVSGASGRSFPRQTTVASHQSPVRPAPAPARSLMPKEVYGNEAPQNYDDNWGEAYEDSDLSEVEIVVQKKKTTGKKSGSVSDTHRKPGRCTSSLENEGPNWDGLCGRFPGASELFGDDDGIGIRGTCCGRLRWLSKPI